MRNNNRHKSKMRARAAQQRQQRTPKQHTTPTPAAFAAGITREEQHAAAARGHKSHRVRRAWRHPISDAPNVHKPGVITHRKVSSSGIRSCSRSEKLAFNRDSS